MDLFIQLKDGKPEGHPIPDWSLKMCYPDLDPKNPPEGYARFHREPYPTLENQTVDGVSYELSNYYSVLYETTTYTDIYNIRDLTQEEIEIKKSIQRNIPLKPDDGKVYYWDHINNKWVNVDVAIKVFHSFFMKYKIDPTTFDFSKLDSLTDEQKVEYANLIVKYNDMVNNPSPVKTPKKKAKSPKK